MSAGSAGRRPKPPSPLEDQLLAAAADADRVMALASKFVGRPIAVMSSRGWLGRQFAGLMDFIQSGPVQACGHIRVAGGPMPLFVALSRPGVLLCRRCAEGGGFAEAGDGCDVCKRSVPGEVSVVLAQMVGSCLVVSLGSCASCRGGALGLSG
jgi:hypothetical protein